jgi:RimJ/RimL family protein N-acetyltransferase
VKSVSLIPLNPNLHTEALQQVYALTPGYWEMYHLPGAPAGQAGRDLAAVQEEAGRTALGILLPNQPGDPAAGAQLIGLLDFRMDWPEPGTVYVGMVMVAEPFQRQGAATAAWALLEEWLAGQAGVATARLTVEQFNSAALRFFQHLGFELTGEARRTKSGQRLVRLLVMEKEIGNVKREP